MFGYTLLDKQFSLQDINNSDKLYIVKKCIFLFVLEIGRIKDNKHICSLTTCVLHV